LSLDESKMAQCMECIKDLFPAIDDEMYHYIDGK